MSASPTIEKAPTEPSPIRDWVGRPTRLIDLRTGAVIAAMLVGFPALVILQQTSRIPFWSSFVLGTLLMNLSFTAWHEPAHGNFSRSAIANHVAGFLASFASMYPGYFARRREHLIHHKFQGIEGKDPAFSRIQSSAWTFPLQLVRANYVSPPLDVPDSFLPITPMQRWSDRASNVGALGLVAASVALGFWPSLLAAWVLPRVLVFWLHAYYVCFFPHSVKGGGYEIYRVREDGYWLPFLTVAQNFHGIHHKWPSIPWHQYRTVLRTARREVEEAGISLL